MKRLVLNMVCRLKTDSRPDLSKALVDPNFQLGSRAENSPIPLFLRDVGKYYWNKEHVFSEYNTSVCLKNMYTRMFRFFRKQRKLFYKACEHGNLEAVKYLSRKDKNNLSDERGLYQACFAGRLKVVKYLIQQGTNMYSGCGDNAMVSACRKGRTDVVKYLVSAGFDLKEGWEEYTYPLCENNYLDTLKFLLKIGVKPNPLGLIRACYKGHFEIVECLMENGVNIQFKNDGLREACRKGHLKLVKYLVTKGVDIYARPWDCAGSEIAEYLREKGAAVKQIALEGEPRRFTAYEISSEDEDFNGLV